MNKKIKDEIERILRDVRLEIAVAKGDLDKYKKTNDFSHKEVAYERLEYCEYNLNFITDYLLGELYENV